jgi:hypothetical protein
MAQTATIENKNLKNEFLMVNFVKNETMKELNENPGFLKDHQSVQHYFNDKLILAHHTYIN